MFKTTGKVKKIIRYAIVALLVFIFGFSDFFSVLPAVFQGSKLADNFRVRTAEAAVPTFVAAGAVAVNAAAITPALPAGIAAGDILLLFLETSNQAITISNSNGGTWTEVIGSPQGTGTGANNTSVRLTVFWSRYNGTQGAPTTSDSGNHQLGRMIAVRGVIASGDPWDITSGGIEAVADRTGVIPGAITTVADTFVVAAIGTALPRSTGTAGFTAWVNADLASITERIDNTTKIGLGGGLGVATGTKALIGAYANTTVTNSTNSVKAMMSIALKPQPTTTLSIGTDPGDSAIAPGGAITPVDGFTLTTSSGTDAITDITVDLSTNNGVGTLTITDGSDTVLGSIGGGTGSGIVTGLNSIPITSTNATTGGTAFKVKVTPLLHLGMPAPAGGSYAITGVVTDWAGFNTKAGQAADTSSTVTIDNLSPAGTTGASATPGDAEVSVSWTPPADYQQVYIYCKTNSMTSGEAPAEGSDPAVDGTVCDGTARMKYKGTASPQIISSLVNGTLYYFRIYARDVNGNFTAYSAAQEVSATPQLPPPNATSYTNIEAGLNNFGGRIGQTITVIGTNFGTVNAGSRATCAGGSGTGCLRIGAYTIPDGSVTGWTSTTITFSIPSAISVYGTTLTVTAASQSDSTPLNFKVYPDITSVSPSGSGEAKEGDSITITGTRFGSTQGTNKVIIDGVMATITGWTDTSINATVPAAINDSNNSVTVRAYQGTEGDNTIYDDSAGFVILPSVTSITVPTGISNAAREYSLSDSDGIITLNGTHFGAAGTVTILGVTATQTTTGTCAGSAYQAICIGLQVPASIADNSYTGNIVVTRTSDSKTNTFADFRILPRIFSTAPVNLKGGRGDTVSITGNHLCQSGTCPTSFSAANSVNFTGGSVTSGSSTWTDTSIPSIVIPPGATDGALHITSNTSYTSNNLTYDIKFAPATPANSAPVNGAIDQSKNPTITAGAFSDGTDGDTHSDSTWQITRVSGDYTAGNKVWEDISAAAQTTIAVNETNGVFTNTVLSTELNCGTTYYWHVRYKDSGTVASQEWSAYSPEFSFSTVFCDTIPPTPNPMTFFSAPANFSASQIDMTATTATDASTPPVSYFFTLDNSTCANAGTGGTSGDWQSGTAYSDIGLQPNKCYGYTVKARDSAGTPNETTASGIFTAYTSANVPGTPVLDGATSVTLNLTNAENSNPASNPTTLFAVQMVTTSPSDVAWLNKWVNASGNPVAVEVWLTDVQLDGLVLQGLQISTLYGVKVKAKNEEGDITAFSAEGQGTTLAGNAVPTITNISPASKTIGDPEFTMMVNGTNFITGSVVKFDGGTRVTNLISETQLLVTIPATDLTVAGMFLIVVENPSPGGGDSNAKIFTVHNVIPSITSILPSSKPVGADGFTLEVFGVNFASNSQVRFGGSDRDTTFIDTTKLSAIIPASDLTVAGTFSITVFNPATGETSNTQQFTVGPLGRYGYNYSRTFHGSGSLRR